MQCSEVQLANLPNKALSGPAASMAVAVDRQISGEDQEVS